MYPRLSMRLTELVTPLKPLEAMAQGRLVVASDVGGHRELIRDGETGDAVPRRATRARSPPRSSRRSKIPTGAAGDQARRRARSSRTSGRGRRASPATSRVRGARDRMAGRARHEDRSRSGRSTRTRRARTTASSSSSVCSTCSRSAGSRRASSRRCRGSRCGHRVFGDWGDVRRSPGARGPLRREVLHPRFLTIPKIGMGLQPRALAAAAEPVLRRLARGRVRLRPDRRAVLLSRRRRRGPPRRARCASPS